MLILLSLARRSSVLDFFVWVASWFFSLSVLFLLLLIVGRKLLVLLFLFYRLHLL